MNRRSFLRMLGFGVPAVAVGSLLPTPPSAGIGGLDSQVAVLRLTPGERVICIPKLSARKFVYGDVLNAILDGLRKVGKP